MFSFLVLNGLFYREKNVNIKTTYFLFFISNLTGFTTIIPQAGNDLRGQKGLSLLGFCVVKIQKD